MLFIAFFLHLDDVSFGSLNELFMFPYENNMTYHIILYNGLIIVDITFIYNFTIVNKTLIPKDY